MSFLGRAKTLRGGTNPTRLGGVYVPQVLLYAQTSVLAGDTQTGAAKLTFATTATIKANTMRVGQVYTIRARGVYSTHSTPGNVTTICELNAVTIGTTTANAGTASQTIAVVVTVISSTLSNVWVSLSLAEPSRLWSAIAYEIAFDNRRASSFAVSCAPM